MEDIFQILSLKVSPTLVLLLLHPTLGYYVSLIDIVCLSGVQVVLCDCKLPVSRLMSHSKFSRSTSADQLLPAEDHTAVQNTLREEDLLQLAASELCIHAVITQNNGLK